MVAVLVLLVLACAAGAAVFVFRGQIFKSSAAVASTNQVAAESEEMSTHPQNQTRTKPAPLVAPPANDTNWMLNLEAAVIPGSTGGRADSRTGFHR